MCSYIWMVMMTNWLVNLYLSSGTYRNVSATIKYPTQKLASMELHAVLDSMWESIEPVGNVELLPLVNNPTVCLLSQKKPNAEDVIPCLLCEEKDIGVERNEKPCGKSHTTFLAWCWRSDKLWITVHWREYLWILCQDSCFTQLKAKKKKVVY